MTMGFDPFELPNSGLLQKGWDHSLPKALNEKTSFRLAFTELRITNQIGGGAQWVELVITTLMSEPTH